MLFGVIFWKYKPPGGAAGDETLVFGKPNFTKESGFEKYLVDFLNVFFKQIQNLAKWHSLFEAVLMGMVTKLIVYEL